MQPVPSMLGLLAVVVAATPALAGSPDFDLRANVPLAHVQRAGVVADATSPGFIRYTRD